MAIQSVFFARHQGVNSASSNTFVSAHEQVIDLGGSEVLLFLKSLRDCALNWAKQPGMAVRYQLDTVSFDAFFFSDSALRLVTTEADKLMPILNSASERFDVDVLPRPELQSLHFQGPAACDFLQHQFSLFSGMALGRVEQHYGVQRNDYFVVASAAEQQFYRVFARSSALDTLKQQLVDAHFNPKADAA